MNLYALLTNHPFWGLLTIAVLVWYSTVTIYVAVRGVADIRHMLRNLRKNHDGDDATGIPSGGIRG